MSAIIMKSIIYIITLQQLQIFFCFASVAMVTTTDVVDVRKLWGSMGAWGHLGELEHTASFPPSVPALQLCRVTV